MKRCVIPFLAVVAFALSGCAYLGTWARQSYYSLQLRHSPRQATSKHLLERETFFVFGKVESANIPSGTAVAVLAISLAPVRGEIVDVCQSVRDGSYYGLNLPAGDYRIVAAADLNGDGTCTEKEVLGVRSITLQADAAEKVRGDFDLGPRRSEPGALDTFSVAVARRPDVSPSVFYPKGSIRRLDDPIFSPRMASLGLYEPAAFLEAAPMMFYALEEDLGYKVPVVFVHGIDGSARDFGDIVARLDARRYRAWFFHYPSGGDLHQLGAMFYEIFLSGNTIPRADCPLVIVAHSMGGLVVREALNHYRNSGRETVVGSFITLASPLAGHPAAGRGVHAPVVIPSWRDLDPGSRFIRDLHRAPLPAGSSYYLFSTVGDPRAPRTGEAGDGVVPLASQLSAAAVREATSQFAFPCSHTGVLHDDAAVARIVETITKVKSTFPDDHLRVLDRGGYAMALPVPEFSPLDAFFVKYLGHYLDAMVAGEIQPLNEAQRQFVDECLGRRDAQTPAAQAWLKLNRLQPRRAGESRRATHD